MPAAKSKHATKPVKTRTPASRLAPQPHGGALKRNVKTTVKSTEPVSTGDLVAQPHGGALRHGGTNKGGPGRPPSAIRDSLRLSYDRRKEFLDEVIDGKVLVHTEVPLAAVIPHIQCSSCKGPVIAKNTADLFTMTIPARVSASVKDRREALEQLAKYGLGQLKEVSVENVRARVTETLRIIGLHCDAALAETLYQAIEPVWK